MGWITEYWKEKFEEGKKRGKEIKKKKREEKNDKGKD